MVSNSSKHFGLLSLLRPPPLCFAFHNSISLSHFSRQYCVALFIRKNCSYRPNHWHSENQKKILLENDWLQRNPQNFIRFRCPIRVRRVTKGQEILMVSLESIRVGHEYTQMYSSTSMSTFSIHEYEYEYEYSLYWMYSSTSTSTFKCTRVRVHFVKLFSSENIFYTFKWRKSNEFMTIWIIMPTC